MPIKTMAAKGIRRLIELYSELEGFSHMALLHHFHKILGTNLMALHYWILNHFSRNTTTGSMQEQHGWKNQFQLLWKK